MSSPALTPAAIRNENGKFTNTVNGAGLALAPNKADAITALCRHAAARGEAMVVTITDRATLSHLAISPDGDATPCTPPAPASVRPGMGAEDRVDLGFGAGALDDTKECVQRTMFATAPAAPEARAQAPTKRRFSLRRR